MPETITFILSTGRTGTKALADGLAGNGILSPHQPPWSRRLNIASNMHFDGRIPRSTVERLVKMTRERQIRRAECRHYVQVFPLDHLPALILRGPFPELKVVHIVRDPRTCVRSYLNLMHSRWKSWIANKLVPAWHPSGARTGDVPAEKWRAMDEFQRVCWQWSWKNTWLEKAFGASPGYLRVRFEDLFKGDAGAGELRRMLSFAGIPYEDRFAGILREPRNVTRKDYCPPHAEWPAQKTEHLRNICGDVAGRYGYGL